MKLKDKLIEDWIEEHIELSFSRSGGPGGQNVNRLNTKVTARLSVSEMEILSPQERDRVRFRLRNRINNRDELIVRVEEERKQYRNRKIAVRRMVRLIIKALEVKRRRISTRPTLASRERRARAKRIRAAKKRLRKRVEYVDE
ncbi:Peptidyl-tRNA hydrolase ArfB [subsurface metagenome]